MIDEDMSDEYMNDSTAEDEMDRVMCALFDDIANPTHVTMNSFRRMIKVIVVQEKRCTHY